MLPKEDRNLIMIAGRYMYYKMKDLGLPLTIEAYNNYLDVKAKEKKLKDRIGYREFNKMKELGLNYEEYKQYQKEQKLKRYERKREKDKVRFKTIRYIERYCNLEMKCQICNVKENIEIHHPNYNDYLKINLLCKKHHTMLHNFELIPPKIINLEKIAIKKPALEEKRKNIEQNLKNMKIDVLENHYTYKGLYRKYGIATTTIKTYFAKEKNYQELEDKLRENCKRSRILKSNSNKSNPLLKYKQKYNLNSRQLSEITHIPLATIRAIETGKTKIENITSTTKHKLNILNKTQLDTK